MPLDAQYHPLWGRQTPLSNLTSLGFILIASGRTAFALLGTFAAIWTFVATVLTASMAASILPRFGRPFILMILASFYSLLFLLFLAILSPVMAAEAYLHLLLVPALFMASGVWGRVGALSWDRAVKRALLEALVLGSVLVALALVREPFGFGSISVPGPGGITELLGSPFAADAAIRLVASSAGALVLLGYSVALYRALKVLINRSNEIQEQP